MSRWDAPSDYDYDDEPWARSERCATPGCDHDLSPLSASIYCEDCRDQQRARAEQDDRDAQQRTA